METIKNKKGYVIYNGSSLIDGKPIVVVATMETKNRKTGNMVQTWILRSDINPIEAFKNKEDSSICGQCPHRWALKGDCYVNIGQAPLSIFKAWKRGSYLDITALDNKKAFFEGREIRLGSYGDPSAVPKKIWDSILNDNNQTGYTHQWKDKDSLKSFTMASVDTIEEKLLANASGWRTFRVSYNDVILNDEILCPSENGVACKDCGLCGGSNVKAKNIVILAHGSRANKKLETIPC